MCLMIFHMCLMNISYVPDDALMEGIRLYHPDKVLDEYSICVPDEYPICP